MQYEYTVWENTYMGWEKQMLRKNDSNKNKKYAYEKAQVEISKIFT